MTSINMNMDRSSLMPNEGAKKINSSGSPHPISIQIKCFLDITIVFE